jgi:SAM-dependent methyltransferase
MRDEMHLGDGPRKILHFAPELQIARRLAALPAVEYITADLAPGNAMEQIDMTDIPKPDGSFDLVIVNHVLEHIPDDRAAIAEIARILRPGGIFLTMHPVMETATTFEDETIVVPEERLQHFGQEDHVRVYGQDFVKRLTDAGFSVDVIRYSDEVASPADRERYGLVEQLEWTSPSAIYNCTRR